MQERDTRVGEKRAERDMIYNAIYSRKYCKLYTSLGSSEIFLGS